MVEIPVIMPKPDLMALTGGYRKTPVLQVGADIYCDTALICRLIDRSHPTRSVYPADQTAALGAAVHWTDTFLFKVSVAVAFQPKALAGSDLFSDQTAAAAFMADRAELSKGSTELGIARHCVTLLDDAYAATGCPIVRRRLSGRRPTEYPGFFYLSLLLVRLQE